MSAAALTIGEFSMLSRLSPKALRLYDELGLLVPARVDPVTGYRWYAAEQLERARSVALLRHLEMPLARIAAVLELPAPQAADAVRDYWDGVERATSDRRVTAEHLYRRLNGGTTMTEPSYDVPSYDVQVRPVPERALLSAVRHVHADDAGATLGALLGRMRRAGPGLSGLQGAPFLVYLGAVTADSDGPVEVARPMTDLEAARRAARQLGDVEARCEQAHDEIYLRVTMAQVGWPALMPVLDALEEAARRLGRTPAGPARQVMIADWRTAAPDTPACDVAVPLVPISDAG